MKKFFAILLCLSLLSCFAGCKSETTVVGKWLSDRGKCLDIQDDGTWLLDGYYGSGTWKYLDDGHSLAFTDFYGQVEEVQIEEDDTGKYICINNIKYYKEKVEHSENMNDSFSSNSFLKAVRLGDFKNGFAHVELENNGCAIVNTHGEVVFQLENVIYAEFNGKIGYYKQKIEDKIDYYIFNDVFKIVASSKDGLFDEVLACGENVALVYKHKGGIEKDEHLYGVLNNEGGWETTLKDLGISGTSAHYVNCNVFAIDSKIVGMYNVYSGDHGHLSYYNYKTDKIIYNVYDSYGITSSFNNGKIYMESYQPYYLETVIYNWCDKSRREYDDEAIIRSNLDDNEYAVLDFYGNKTIKQTDGYTYISGDKLVKNGEKAIEITDIVTNEVIVFDDYSPERVTINFENDYGGLYIEGADGSNYVAIINDSGKMLLEPKKITKHSFYADCILVNNSIYDTDGNLLVEELQYSRIGDFCDGLASAENENGELCYINTMGEVVIAFEKIIYE